MNLPTNLDAALAYLQALSARDWSLAALGLLTLAVAGLAVVFMVWLAKIAVR